MSSILPRLSIGMATLEVPMANKSSVILHRIWRSFYKPTLNILFRESASKGVSLTPDKALKKMERAFQSVFLSVKEESSSAQQKDRTPRPRLYFRFAQVAFRREAHHYAVDLFYDTYFLHKHEGPHAALKVAGGNRSEPALPHGTRVMSQPQMIRDVLLEHGGPLDVDKISAAIEKKFQVKLKRHDITSVIYRAMRKGKIFRKEGINTFALVE